MVLPFSADATLVEADQTRSLWNRVHRTQKGQPEPTVNPFMPKVRRRGGGVEQAKVHCCAGKQEESV